jgi:hypothetical protein
VRSARKSDEHCINSDSVTVEAWNACDGPRSVKICLERRNGKLDCGGWEDVAQGSTTDYWICRGTGRYRVEVK